MEDKDRLGAGSRPGKKFNIGRKAAESKKEAAKSASVSKSASAGKSASVSKSASASRAAAGHPTRPLETAYMAEHEVAGGETLSAIALKYYKSAAREKWMAIYEANKDVIGDNPGLIKVGQVLKIPELD